VVTTEQAQRLADRWLADNGLRGGALLDEFDEGYVVTPASPRPGDGRGVIDRETGEISAWPSLPTAGVIERYREFLTHHPRAPLTWNPTTRVRYALTRRMAPATATHLALADGRQYRGISMKGDGRPDYHPLVLEVVLRLPPEDRERGFERCAEVAALSDALHTEDARREAAGQPAITAEEASEVLFRGARATTYKVRESGDPEGGEISVPCISCMLLYERFGFRPEPPTGMYSPADAADAADAADEAADRAGGGPNG
jgi:hypothetical protein